MKVMVTTGVCSVGLSSLRGRKAIPMGATRYGAGRGRRGLRGSEPSVCNGMENPAAWVWPPPPNDAAIEPTSVPSSRERML